MMRPWWVTTNAAVIPSAGSNAASTACATFAASTPSARGTTGTASPMGHIWVQGSGRVLGMSTGSKKTSSASIGRVTQPWSPLNFAVRTTPSGRVRCTRRWSRSTSVAVTCARCS